MKETLVIMPCYNEGMNIRTVLTKLLDLKYDIDIVVINDGSKDNTLDEIEGLDVFSISHPFNMGYGAALQTGFKFAVSKGYKYIIQLDADGQHDVAFIKNIQERLMAEDVDLVIGSRFLSEENEMAFGLTKRIAINFFKFLIYKLGKKKLTDPTSGYKGMSIRLFSHYAGMGNFPNDFPDADVLIETLRRGYELDEVPVVMRDRMEGESMHSGLKPIYYMLKVTLSIMIVLIRQKTFKEDKI